MVRGYLLDNIWQALAELSNFFRQLCAKELSRAVISDMEKVAPVLLCKMEKIFPSAFFNPMHHCFYIFRMRHGWGACAVLFILTNSFTPFDFR